LEISVPSLRVSTILSAIFLVQDIADAKYAFWPSVGQVTVYIGSETFSFSVPTAHKTFSENLKESNPLEKRRRWEFNVNLSNSKLWTWFKKVISGGIFCKE